jgi:hypothetical protein
MKRIVNGIHARPRMRPALRALRKLVGAAGLTAGCLAAAAPAWSFDTGPHFDITRDTLTSEGFGNTSIQVSQVNNWFVDLYENASKLPHSGHASFFRTLVGGGLGDSENWPQSIIDAADRSHFDSANGGHPNTAALTKEWDRLRRSVYSLVRQARSSNDPLKALTVLSISLHQVQDFYTHTNWVEPNRQPDFDGPGWRDLGLGSTPTWFDVPEALRNSKNLYGAGPGVARGHGDWDDEGNLRLQKYFNKDWSGRPLYMEAYTAAYFATRQWVRAVRSWVNDEPFWSRVRLYADRAGSSLDHDLKGLTGISIASGHWQGQGEPFGGSRPGPGGSLLDLRGATVDFFEDHPPTVFRRTWENNIRQVAVANPPAAMGDVPSSLPLQQTHLLVSLQVTEFAEIDNLDIPGEADFYARASIGGQEYQSAQINDKDSFRFTLPHHPFTFVKALPKSQLFAEPLCNLRIEVKTSGSSNSGTDDDVFLRINDGLRFQLDKPLYNDFEKGDRDMYSLPVERHNLTIGDLRYLQIEKSKDGLFGGWKLEGVKVFANNRLIYQNNTINRWIEDDKRVFRLPGFSAASPVGAGVPIRLELYDADSFLRGADDHCDIQPDHDRKNLLLFYDPQRGTYGGDLAGFKSGASAGGDRYGGRLSGDDDQARLRFRLETFIP